MFMLLALSPVFSAERIKQMLMQFDNHDKDVEVGYIIQVTSPSGKQQNFKKESVIDKEFSFCPLLETGKFNIKVYIVVPSDEKATKLYAKSEFYISGDETSVQARITYGRNNIVWCQSQSINVKPCTLYILKNYQEGMQGRFDEEDEKSTDSAETFPASLWDVKVKSRYGKSQ